MDKFIDLAHSVWGFAVDVFLVVVGVEFSVNNKTGMPKLKHLRKTRFARSRLYVIRVEDNSKGILGTSKWLLAVLANPHITKWELGKIALTSSLEVQTMVLEHKKSNIRVLKKLGNHTTYSKVRNALLADVRIPEEQRTLWALQWGSF